MKKNIAIPVLWAICFILIALEVTIIPGLYMRHFVFFSENGQALSCALLSIALIIGTIVITIEIYETL